MQRNAQFLSAMYVSETGRVRNDHIRDKRSSVAEGDIVESSIGDRHTHAVTSLEA